jgi:hypothetical protein
MTANLTITIDERNNVLKVPNSASDLHRRTLVDNEQVPAERPVNLDDAPRPMELTARNKAMPG